MRVFRSVRPRRENSLRDTLCPWRPDPGEEKPKEDIYEKMNFELSHGAGPVPDAAAHGGAGGGCNCNAQIQRRQRNGR